CSFNLPSMLAGKMHALLFRKWANRVKGRDWYDWVWYAARKVPVNLNHLSARMRQTGQWTSEVPILESELKQLLHDRVQELDVNAARRDVEPFLRNPDSVAVWSTPFFEDLASRLRTE
ncbi:MAG TPA: nucleotidyl transferase AbiEii/AbiGii toxin family protein, partial [Kiritimatiellia bacterium]|nr:nucleotidyl transferase AbiEii/AbiGii toxin family protein [Kiritimatiellia bacterium]